MEKTTKKSKKKSRRLKKRIGIIAVGGLSFVLTICLSVGATLAWFAGSSWASNDLYMGGPVYVEMAGRGNAEGTEGSGAEGTEGAQTANWIGGAGNLDIEAASTRTTGTVIGGDPNADIPSNILLPGQKVQIYSQARVFSTAETDSRADGEYANNSSGANTNNTSNHGTGTGTATYLDGSGRVTSTTTSVLRARFSISIEFDPSVGFNNFTNEDYMTGYPKQSQKYTGAHAGTGDLEWTAAMSTAESEDKVWSQIIDDDPDSDNFGKTTITGRRDGVSNAKVNGNIPWTAETSGTDDSAIRSGTTKSIYKWRYVSKSEYDNEAKASLTDLAGKDGLLKMASSGVLGGQTDTTHTTAAYACYIVENGAIAESDAFYKARTNAYLDSYVEYYENEYGNRVERKIGDSLESLDQALNNDFKKIVNDSSDDIQNGLVYGYTVTSGVRTKKVGALTNSANGGTGSGVNASWLYIDPSIGNDTNTNEISTSTGGWWYLVDSTGLVAGQTDANEFKLVADETDANAGAAYETGKTKTTNDGVNLESKLKVGESDLEKAKRGTEGFSSTDSNRLYAKLYEISPTLDLNTLYSEAYVGKNGSEDVSKVVSVSFPFVNGTFALPGDALTNVFANAKISFQISFQAIQAFFPYTTTIDNLTYKDDLFGVAKVLNIKNAIPIFNEAFDYQEKSGGVDSAIPL